METKQPGRKVVVTGCAAERTKESLEDRFPFVDLVVGAKSIEDFSQIGGTADRSPPTDEESIMLFPRLTRRLPRL